MMTVLILGDFEDYHTQHMADHLDRRAERVAILDSRSFPGALRISYDPSTDGGEFHLGDGQRVAFEDVKSVYWRSYHGVAGPTLPSPQQSHIAENDARSLFESVLIRLPARWVNSWQAFQFHQTKPAQLAAVARLDVPVPRTLLSNDPQAVKQFASRAGPVIFKPVQGGAHTRRITSDMLADGRLAHLRLAPITLQEEIEGTNIRVFVAGDAVMACEVRTEHVDFRDDASPDITAHPLPQDMQTQCRRIAHALHLVWTGIDFRLTPEGRYVFLEANPSPMFLGFQEAANLPLTERLGDLLAGA